MTKMTSAFLVLLALSTTVSNTSAWASPPKELPLTKAFDGKELKWGPAPAFMPQGSELAVLHGDPSKKNSDVFLRIPANGTIPSHWHTSAERMVLVSGEMLVTYEGQAPLTLKAGNYAYGPAKLKHDAACKSQAPCVLFIAFEGPIDAVPTIK